MPIDDDDHGKLPSSAADWRVFLPKCDTVATNQWLPTPVKGRPWPIWMTLLSTWWSYCVHTIYRCWCNTRKFIRLAAVLGYQRSIDRCAVSRGARWHLVQPCAYAHKILERPGCRTCRRFFAREDSPSRTEKALFHSRTERTKKKKHAEVVTNGISESRTIDTRRMPSL